MPEGLLGQTHWLFPVIETVIFKFPVRKAELFLADLKKSEVFKQRGGNFCSVFILSALLPSAG